MLLCTSTVSTLFCKYLVGISFTGNHFKISLAAWGEILSQYCGAELPAVNIGVCWVWQGGGGAIYYFPAIEQRLGIRRGINMGTEIGGKN